MATIKIPPIINIANAIYQSNSVRKALNIESGDRLSMEIVDGALIIKPYFDIKNWAYNYLFVHKLGHSAFYKIGRDKRAGITTVILFDGRVGVAQCNPNDKFSNFVGEAIALARALGKEDEIPDEVFK